MLSLFLKKKPTQSFSQVLCIIARKYLDYETSRQFDKYFKRFEIELKK